ncbi:immunoglobulin superfamily member 10-like [Cyprinodon tularosa]|uniref:immunoglobulin superfamily member 10-like n=1 Tax=Cyprinodon tularosa TaxID=77115 RepID=UPI0018E27073|nr:immunoglobulin superfamily member 10-like [Cyprinodon tularosa]
MKREHCTLWLLQTLLVLLPPGLPAPCPRPCSCPHPAELHCTFRSLLSVPGAVSRHVKRVNLGFNSIGHIGVGSLSGLKKLELLMVHGNNIHSLPDGAFRDLASLQMMKMSYNKLKEINRRTFHGLWSLSRLHLDHNQLELIHPDAFQGLTSLRFLQLEGNRLQQLHATTFRTFALRDQFYISTLRHLHLSDNGLTSLPSQLLGTMPHLESLYLHGNPWTCDCGMSWFHDLEKDSPGVLKCKKDRDLPGGQLCPSCSSPRPLKDTDLHAAAPLVCSSPVISLLHGTSPPPESERQMLTSKDFKDPIGNISMGLSDEHGNKLDLECSVDELQEPSKVSWEQVSKLQLLANVSLSVELQCAVDRKKYEQLWKAIAYYSNVPAHLKRGPALTKDPELAYAYEQDSELDAGYYTGLKVQMWARPAWLMQPSVELQLNRAESSIRTVILALRTTLSELVETEQQQRLGRTWVMIDSTNRTRKVMSAILGSPSEMFCNVRSSDPAEIRWTLPDGSELASPYSGPGNRVSVSRDGQLRIKAVTHSDTGTFYCMAKVPGDVAVLSFYLSVQESSSPPPGDDTSAVSMEEFAGNPISMDCPASSSPDAEINWILPSSQIVHSQDNSSKALVHFNGSLHISKTQVSDSGYYKCVAINQHGADTMVKKVSIVRRSGLIRPLRRFPVRPQSASGVSTQVKIPTENAEEASGDVDASTIRHRISGVRRRIPGNLAPGRKGIHPSRSTWQRRTMLRGSHTENQNGSAENRRRIHLSKSKIDPKKWAHILAKARERDAVSPLPASYPTKIEKALTTESLKTPDKSSDGVTVHDSEDQQYLPEQSTEPQIKEFPPHGEDDHVTTEPYSERGAANNSRHLTTAPHPTESAYTAQRTTQHTEPNLVTSSDGGFSLPQTTSVPPHGITISQPSARTASGSTVQTADPSEGRQSGAEPDDVISSINHRFSLESQTNSVKREGSGNYLGETSTLSQFEPKDATESRSEVEPSKSPSTAPKPPGRRKSESKRRPVGSKRRNGGRRKRPNRKKEKLDASNTIRPAAKASISELNTEQPRVTVGSSSAVPSTGSQAASSSRLSHKESSVLRQNHKALTETFPLPETKDGRLLLPRASWQSSTAAPSLPALTHGNSMLGTADTLEDSFETSFTTEPAPLLHYDSLTGRYDSLTELQRVHQATGMETSTQPYQFTSTASSTAGGQKAASRETSRGILSTSRRLPKHRNHSSGQKEVTKTDLTPRENQQTSLNAWTDVMRSLETAVASITSTLPPRVLLPHSHRQSKSQDTTIAGRDVITSNFHPTTFPTNHKPSNTSPAVQVLTSIPPPTVVSPTPFQRTPVRPQGSTQEEWTPVRPQGSTQEERTPVRLQVSTQEEGTPVHPQGSKKEDRTLVSTQEERTPVRPQGSTQEEGTPVCPQVTTQEEGTPVRLQVSTQEEGTPVHPQGSKKEDRTLVSTQEERTPVRPQGSTQEEGTPVCPQVTTQEEGTPVHPQGSKKEDRTLVSTQEERTPVHPQVTSQEEGTPVHPQVTTQEEGTPVHQQMSTQDEQTLGHTSNQRGKPRITTDRSQTITVRTGADAQLPCDTKGQPMPFLSWTKASSGVSIAKNMRWQRLEVHHNGTLIIRNSQETDAGRYLCTVQNQYGTDTMTATLLVSHQPPLRDIHVYEGGKAELECKVAGDPRVSWILPNSVQMTATSAAAPSPPQRVAVDEMGTLLISSAHLMDAGIYRCSVPGGNGMQVRLRVSAVPALIEQEKDQTVVVSEGSAAYIHCAASTATRPIIRWIAPGGMQLPDPHPPNGGNFIVFPNGTLHIKRLASKDSGRYICTAGNAAASSSRAVILRVISKPSSAKATITASSPKTTDVTYGSPLLLNCVAAGEPEPRIIWRTPSKKLVDHQFSFDSRIKVFLNGSLSIHSVTDKDRGDYLCVARNKMGDDYIQLRVNVLTKPAKIEQKMQKSSQEVIRGQDLKVDCVASGLPSPQISWALPDGTMVNPVKQRARVGGGRSRRYVVFDNGTLYFNEVGLPEEGDYICYAQNQLGKDEMKVRVRVKGETTRPQIQDKGPKTVRVLHGETVALQCKAIGDPVPVVTWMSPKNRLISPDSNKYQVLQDGSLVVQKVQGPDGGNYTCLARSSVGQDDKVTRVEVLPTPPVINGLRGDSDTIEVTAVQGERTLVDCATKGAPSPRVMWILPGNVILPAPYYSNHRTVHPNGTLEIRSTQRTDSGQMVCVARNEGGEVRMLVHLEVKETVRGAKIEAPEKESFALRVGNSVTLNCTIDGLELTHLTWILPDGTPLNTGARISKFFHRLDGSLVISNPSVAEAGVYRCMGRNPAGLFESTITLSPGRKPQILNRYISPVSVLDGETLFLHCQTTGEPLRLTWTLPSGVVLNRLQNAGRYSILQNGTIAIRQASIYDRGAYVCRAANEYGSSLLSVSVKIVANQPRITWGPPSVTYAKHGVAVQLNCATAGTPAAEVSWETPDKVRMVVSAQPRLFGNKYLHPQGSLIIQNPTQRDSGVYRCTARNAAGVDSKTTFLNVF